MAQNFRNILLLSNLGVDLGLPDFRLGTYQNTLLPLARCLLEDSDISVRVLANAYITQRLRNAVHQTNQQLPELATFDAPQEHMDFMIRSYSGPLGAAEIDLVKCCLLEALGDWEPEVILCWETPSQVLRQIYLNATVLDMMPSIFMRPPYPPMIAFDTGGVYGQSWLVTTNQSVAPQSAIDMVSDLRLHFKDHFDELGVPQLFEKLTGGHRLDRAMLLPFQVSQYFGWSDTCVFSSQTELLEAVHANLPPDSDLVCTQYISAHIEERVLTAENLPYWRTSLPHLIYDPKFEVLDNFTQYLVPYVQGMVSVSSTLGLQAKFFGTPLIAPSFSHLASVADGNRLEDLGNITPQSQDNLMAVYLGRSCFLKERLLSEPGYFSDILHAFVARRSEKSVEKFPSFEQVGNTAEKLLQCASTDRSQQAFKLFASKIESRRLGALATKDRLPDRSILSFDVFDTLVCRTVLAPKDIFILMRAHLRQAFQGAVPDGFIDGFVHLRQTAERMLTQQAVQAEGDVEEITIAQVYAALTEDFGLSPGICAQLIELEQETELACLRPRTAGQRLFQQALETGRRVIILSDFIHDHDFVERVLRHCGYSGWDALYVSSAIGVKKHSGALFRHVAEDLDIAPDYICHIGDNLHGDIKMALQNGWGAQHLVSTPAHIQRRCLDRKLNIDFVNSSVFAGAILSTYANCYLDNTGHAGESSSPDTELITTAEQMGFLTIGPAMYYFANWLLEEAQRSGCQQIMLFARDTILPYRILKTCFTDQLRQLGISICYIPISRMGASGLDIDDAHSFWSIRIDDFVQSRPLVELFEKRFMLQASEIDAESLAEWTSKPIDAVCVSDIPHYAIYRIAFASAERHGETFFARTRARQDLFRRGLAQWGCDTSLKTLAVDIGYKGTLTRKVQCFFTQPLESRFFASYADALGSDPLADCHAFYLSRQMPQLKETNVFLKYNLIVETMLNENVGTVMGYHASDGSIRVRRDPNVDKAHADAIMRLHDGALTFARVWHDTARLLDKHLSVSPQVLFYFLAQVLRDPTAKEARLLAPLEFDNSFAGHQSRRLIQSSETGVVQGGIWKEGVARLRQESRARSGLLRALSQVRLRLPHRAVRFFVKKFSNERLLNKFDRDPYAFFNDSAKPMLRRIGNLLYR